MSQLISSLPLFFLRFFIFTSIFYTPILLGQSDLTYISQTDYVALHNTGLNDVWGYVDEQGNEYAIVGTEDGTSIMNVSDPANPFEVFWLPGENSIWRDPSVFGDYAYISTEAEEGLTIIDLSPLPESNELVSTLFTGESGLSWQSAHNCHADDAGYLYVFGANYGEGGVLIYDVNTMPMNPTFVGAFDNWYVHDGVAFGDTLYLAHVNDGFLSIVDISDRSNPQLLGTKITPDSFTHNIWPSDNREVVYTTDELPDSFIAAYDITDVNNIIELDRVQSSPGQNVIPHNTFVQNDYLITSYYVDGITIHDAKHPQNLIEVAAYDTYPGQTPTYDGSWGVYPYLPSGIILASDRSEGLYVLQPDYQRASYLEGTITNQIDGNPIGNVSVDIVGNDQENLSSSLGFYATGMPSAGTYDVTYFKVGYESQIISTEITQGNITVQDVVLTPIAPFSLLVNVEDAFGNPIQNAKIKLEHPLITYEGESNGLGEEIFSLFYEDFHNLQVGKWGYITQCLDLLLDSETGVITVVLQNGYYDDFTFDFGWTVSGSAETGSWERGIPNPTDNTVMNGDVDGDCGNMAYVTGNAENLDPDFDDVDNGVTVLSSPVMDLSTYSNPALTFYIDFYCNHGPAAIDDTLKIIVSDGNSQLVESFPPQSDEMVWSVFPLSVGGLDISNITISFLVSDLPGNPNITEAALDLFRVEEFSNINEESSQESFSIHPNPTAGEFVISGTQLGAIYKIRSLNGALLEVGIVKNAEHMLEINTFEAGIYLISVDGAQKKIIKY
jgi:choice-of-anchor B domain-containing protein